MPPEILQKLERLASTGIEFVPADMPAHFVFTRDGFVALVERKGDSFGSIGSSGLLTESGVAMLMWRGEHAYFVGRGFEVAAEPAEVESMQRFSRDLKEALE